MEMNLNGSTCTLRLDEELAFKDHARFRELVKQGMQNKPNDFHIDFTGTRFVDSAGLGMLMLVRQEAGENNCKVKLVQVGHEVMDIFRLVKFTELFDINAVA